MVTRNILPEDRLETARQWAIRARDPAFDDWDALMAWLEEDADNAAAYEAAQDDAEWANALFAIAPKPLPAPAERHVAPPPRRRLLRYGGAAMAASVALVAGLSGWIALHGGGPRDVVTAPGEHRTVDLADGSRAMLNGATRLRLDPARPREIEMAGGEATFEIRHDAANPFVIHAGSTRLVDAGTVFNVIDRQGALDVAVAEGAVIYGAADRTIRLDAGKALSRASRDAMPVVRDADPEAVGSWRTGHLQYSAAPLREVAADLSRNIGAPVEVSGVADMPFSGTLMLAGSPEEVMGRAGPLLGVRFVRDGRGWKAIAADGPPR